MYQLCLIIDQHDATLFIASQARSIYQCKKLRINRLTPNDLYMGRTAPLTSKRCILYIYSTNISTEYFKRALYSPFFFSSKCSLFHNANLFGSCIIHILYTGCAKIKKKFRRQRVKVLKCCADIFFNWQYLAKKNIFPNYANIKVPVTSPVTHITRGPRWHSG